MPTTALKQSPFDHDVWSRVARAGILTGVIDGLFSSVLSVAFYQSTVQRLFQGVASTLLGPEAYGGGNLYRFSIACTGQQLAVAAKKASIERR